MKPSSTVTQLGVIVLLCLSSGCVLAPVSQMSLAGEYHQTLGLNLGSSLTLRSDGSYERTVTFTYCIPLVILKEDGSKEEQLGGWMNRETGKWEISEGYVRLEEEDRQIENPSCEEKYFDNNRKLLVVRELTGLRIISSMGGSPAKLKRMPIRN